MDIASASMTSTGESIASYKEGKKSMPAQGKQVSSNAEENSIAHKALNTIKAWT